MKYTPLRYDEARPNGAGNTIRPLTHSSDLTREGLGVESTQREFKTCDNCGAEFERQPRDWPGRWAARRFCSKRCAVAVGSRRAADLRRVGNPGDHERPCSKCGRVLDLDQFTKSSTGPLGRNSQCRQCASIARKVKFLEDPELARAKDAARRWRRRAVRVYGCDPEPTEKCCTECGQTKALAQFAKGRAKYGRQQICRSCTSAYKKTYAAEHPETGWGTGYRRRAKRYGVEPTIEKFTRVDVVSRYGDGCVYCEVGAFEQLDHYVPVAEGGPHTLANVRPTCTPCNHRKYNMHGDEFEAAP